VTFVAEASIHLSVPPDVAFDALADHASWPDWMPRSFRPVGPSQGTLRSGRRLLVYIAGAPVATPIVVSWVERAREIAWGGGVRGVLAAEHRFLFEPDGSGGTWIRSVEIWSGALAWVARPVVKPLAERVGAEQLAGIARAVRGDVGQAGTVSA
jgi:hypothetical protein